MKKKTLLATALLLAAGLAACGGEKTPTQNSKPAESASVPAGQSSTQTEEKITLTAEKITLTVGETIKITSSVEGVTFSSRDETVGTIAADGTFTALKVGSTAITAKKDGYKNGTITLTVEKAAQKPATAVLEFENAEHYHPDGVWGYPQFGMAYDTPVETTETASGGSSVGWQTTGCKETIRFTSSKAGKVNMGVMVAYNAAGTLEDRVSIKLNGVALDMKGTEFAGPEDGSSYYDWQEIMFNNLDVVAGENSLVFEIVGQSGVNYDCVRLYADGFTFTQLGPKPAAPVENIGKVTPVIKGYEFGPAISGVVLKLNTAVNATALFKDTFVIKTNGKVREVESFHLCNEKGEDISELSSKYVRFDLLVRYESAMVSYGDWGSFPSSNDYGSSPFTYSQQTGMNSWKADLKIEVKLAEGKTLALGGKNYNDELVAIANEIEGRIVADAKDWGEEKTNTDGIRTLRYKAFETDTLKNDGVKNPLIIWLHGQGEGGNDADIALLGNDVTNLGQEKVQSHFVKGQQKGAYVLAVQTPTMWMDNGNGQNNNGEAHSIYTTLLKDTIDKYVAANADVDAKKIIIGGCSNGGYMTMEMALTYPSYFAAYYPTCEAYKNSFVSDEDIAKLKNLSIWFTHAANDTTVKPDDFTVATYKRLMAAGATDVHFSYFEKVLGNEGRIDGQQNEYQGHYSWIYVLKDECNKDVADPTNPVAPSSKDVLVGGKAVSLWGWAASK